MRVTVSRHAHFNAAHRLYNPDWDAEKNKEVFGKCTNPRYHGHNYELIVHVNGQVDSETGYVVDMKWLADLIKAEIEDRYDHKNLNEEVEEFKNINPTAENIAIAVWNRLNPHLNKEHSLKITLYETPRNFVSYEGQ
jgi:6-pyruvoyltetrahydropterin/6-carboxytetrahydropterin synthase